MKAIIHRPSAIYHSLERELHPLPLRVVVIVVICVIGRTLRVDSLRHNEIYVISLLGTILRVFRICGCKNVDQAVLGV